MALLVSSLITLLKEVAAEVELLDRKGLLDLLAQQVQLDRRDHKARPVLSLVPKGHRDRRV